MARRVALVILFALALVSHGASAAHDDSRALADGALPELSSLALKLSHEKWSRLVDELMTAAPLSTSPGPAWKKGDAHWDASRAELVARLDAWAKELATDAESKEIVRRKFAFFLDAATAKSVKDQLASPAAKGLPAICDTIHLAAVFAGERPDLKIGSAEFSKAHQSWLETLGIKPAQPKLTPELTALLRSDGGRAYSTARGSALDALVNGLEGQIQLRFYDAQRSILAGIDAKASACAKAKHPRR